MIKKWWAFRDLNPGPTGYEPVALTNWAKGPYSKNAATVGDGNISGASCRIRTYNPPVNSRMLYRWAKEALSKGFAWANPFCCHWPIFPVRLQTSIVGTGELNFRVRNGNGWTLTVKNTNYGKWLTPNTTIKLTSCQEVFPRWMCVPHIQRSGTPSGTRTLDTLIKSQVLYQLS